MLTTILFLLVVSLTINAICFAIAYYFQTDKLTDIAYALSFFLINAILVLQGQNIDAYHVILVAMIAIWAVRLGSFLLYRITKLGRDNRFDAMRGNIMRFGFFWLSQALTAWVLMLPVAFVITSSRPPAWPLALLGLLVWAIGLGVEAVADLQKLRFRFARSRPTPWITSGIWRYARHPNYFGEIAIWLGVYIYSLSALGLPEQVVGAASPLVITGLLLFVSGVPILEKSADTRWGKQAAYQKYKHHTNLLLPLPIGKAHSQSKR